MSWAEVSHETVLDRYGGVNSDRRDRDDANEEREWEKRWRRNGANRWEADLWGETQCSSDAAQILKGGGKGEFS